jgi:isopenicillin N synthase-like dioxygenase
LYGALTKGTGKDMVNASLRTNFYGVDKEGKTLQVTCHAHSDPSGMTILLSDEAPGLEVMKDGKWVKVQPILGSLIVNIGDQLEIASNGIYKSIEHKGMPSIKGGERISLGIFQIPDMEAMVGPVAGLIDEKRPALYKTTSWREYFVDFITAGLTGKNVIERYKIQPV